MPTTVTRLLRDWRSGDPAALERLLPLLYEELRRLARAQLAGERRDHTLQPTALVHEAYLRLAGYAGVDWQDRAHFLALAATTMRRILVSHARRRRAAKRGGGQLTVTLSEDLAVTGERGVDLMAVNDALEELGRLDPRQGRVVELRYFAGLTVEEVAAVLEVSPATVKNDWKMARAWLFNRLEGR